MLDEKDTFVDKIVTFVDKIKKLTLALPPIMFLIGLVILCDYFRKFNIDIIPYLDVSEVLTMSYKGFFQQCVILNLFEIIIKVILLIAIIIGVILFLHFLSNRKVKLQNLYLYLKTTSYIAFLIFFGWLIYINFNASKSSADDIMNGKGSDIIHLLFKNKQFKKDSVINTVGNIRYIERTYNYVFLYDTTAKEAIIIPNSEILQIRIKNEDSRCTVSNKTKVKN